MSVRKNQKINLLPFINKISIEMDHGRCLSIIISFSLPRFSQVPQMDLATNYKLIKKKLPFLLQNE